MTREVLHALSLSLYVKAGIEGIQTEVLLYKRNNLKAKNIHTLAVLRNSCTMCIYI